MKLIVKTLNGKQLPIEVEADWTVRQVKEKIESEHDLKADTLKLIAYGKVLDQDDKPASTYNIKEGDFIVAMVQKPKPAPKPKVEDKKEEEPAATTQPAAATSNPAETQPVAQPQPAATTEAVPETLSPEVEAAINELMAISGKPRELCI